MRLSLLIATMNRPKALQETIDSIIAQHQLPNEIILVDQSTDDKTKLLFESYSGLFASKNIVARYIFSDKPSLVRARNIGANEASGDILCFVDDDVILFPDYLQKVSLYFKDPLIGGVSGNVLVAQPQQGLKWDFRKFLSKLFLVSNFKGRLTPSTLGFPIFEREIYQTTRVEIFPGYSMNFRKALFDKNRCDEWFSGYGFREDVDLSYRISKETVLIMVPDARFIHNSSPINRLDVERLKKMQFRNYKYCFNKFKGQGFLSSIFFCYSIFGLIIMDLIELIFNPFNSLKQRTLLANFGALKELFK